MGQVSGQVAARAVAGQASQSGDELVIVPDCAKCVDLAAQMEKARAENDMSTVTDCRVMIKRHPGHDPNQEPAPTRRQRGG